MGSPGVRQHRTSLSTSKRPVIGNLHGAFHLGRTYNLSFFRIFVQMKPFVLIFSFLLSLLSGGRTEVASTNPSSGAQCHVSEYPATESITGFAHNREICITAAQGYTFAGDDSTSSVSIRIPQSGKRTTPQVRSTFRIVKAGKVIDNNHLHPFLAQSVVHMAGIHIAERYLFSICRLRL